MKLSIVIPAHNEEQRIRRTLTTYHQFFTGICQLEGCACEFVIVLNGCTDDTFIIVEELREELDNIILIELEQAGKGLAVRTGFASALERNNDLIGFVDADMATTPEKFYELVTAIDEHDGIIASRYAPGAVVVPPRPAIKRWGCRLFYEPFVRLILGLNYHDLQCGAKLFKRKVIEKVLPDTSIDDWGFDVELLYLCKQAGFDVIEIPTVWHDQAGSKLSTFSSGFPMLWSLFALRRRLKRKK